jgi:hypothetical protein
MATFCGCNFSSNLVLKHVKERSNESRVRALEMAYKFCPPPPNLDPGYANE